jgi:phosphatidate cytidylyltransferase
MLSYWAAIPNFENGILWVFWTMLVVIVCDIGAFFTGRALGKHLMAPNISPKKTWEGAAGGMICSIIVAVLLGYLFSLPPGLWQVAILGIIVNVIGQAGDLIESLFKRNAGIKDSGTFFPGHGGFLDRIDSHILNGPIVYFFILFFVL